MSRPTEGRPLYELWRSLRVLLRVQRDWQRVNSLHQAYMKFFLTGQRQLCLYMLVVVCMFCAEGRMEVYRSDCAAIHRYLAIIWAINTLKVTQNPCTSESLTDEGARS